MNMNKNRDWLIRKAEQEDGCFVSVGGLVDALEQAEQPSTNIIPFKHAFARFLQLARRDLKLSLEQFAKKVDVDLAELLNLETDDQYTPSIRTVHLLADFLMIPEKKLMALAGLLRVKRAPFKHSPFKLHSRSKPVDTLP